MNPHIDITWQSQVDPILAIFTVKFYDVQLNRDNKYIITRAEKYPIEIHSETPQIGG